MKARRTLAVLTLACLAGACAAPPPLASGRFRDVIDEPLPAFEANEECVPMEAGDRLRYSFNADAPIAFSIRYREGKVLVIPLQREQVRRDDGEFTALTAQTYCIVWEAGVIPAMLDYRVRLIRADANRSAR